MRSDLTYSQASYEITFLWCQPNCWETGMPSNLTDSEEARDEAADHMDDDVLTRA